MSARSLNKVMLIGNLTRDPELRYTPQGTPVCTIGLATNRSWVPSSGGERQEETEFHRLVAWQKLAELCSQLLFKGRKIYAEGRLQTRNWTGQDGNERTTTEVVIDNMIVLDSRRREGETAEVSVPKTTGAEDVFADEGVGKTQAAAAPVKSADPVKTANDTKKVSGKSGTKQASFDKKEDKKTEVSDGEVRAEDIPF